MSESGLPSVEISQSSSPTMRGASGANMMLCSEKSPWTMVVSSSSGIRSGNHAISWLKDSISSVCDARYCLVQRWYCRCT